MWVGLGEGGGGRHFFMNIIMNMCLHKLPLLAFLVKMMKISSFEFFSMSGSSSVAS